MAGGSESKARLAIFFELRDGRIDSRRIYDCFDPSDIIFQRDWREHPALKLRGTPPEFTTLYGVYFRLRAE